MVKKDKNAVIKKKKRFARTRAREQLLRQRKRQVYTEKAAGQRTAEQIQDNQQEESAVSYAEEKWLTEGRNTMKASTLSLKRRSQMLVLRQKEKAGTKKNKENKKKKAHISAVLKENRNVNIRYQNGTFIRKGESAAQQGVKRAKQAAQRVKYLINLVTAGGGITIALLAIIIPICAAAALCGDSDTEHITDGSSDIALVAASQIGNEGGELYWRWYGFSSHVDWCAVFVSWCAEQSGLLDDGSMPKFAVCDDGIRWFIEKGRWFNRNIEPNPGMIIFFDWNQDGRSDHVGIIQRCEDGLVYTIEGNSNDACNLRWYAVGDRCIIGYGTGL